MICIITGAPGSGKTKTAKQLLETTTNSALIDGDWLLAVNPFERNNEDQRKLRYENIADLAKNYHHAGFANIFISFVYMQTSNLEEQIDLLKEIDSVLVFGLIPNEETLRARHAQDTYERENIESSIELNNLIAALESVEKIDNSSIAVEDVARNIQVKLGLA